MSFDQVSKIINELKLKADTGLNDTSLPEITSLTSSLQGLLVSMAKTPTSNFQELKVYLEGKQWPVAVPPSLICDQSSEEDKFERATGIIEQMIEQRLNNLSFLDFGCGEGHVALKAADNNARKAVGYDLRTSGNLAWDQENGYLLTTNLQKVRQNGPYDVILLYDVLDHVEESDPATILKEIKSLLSNKGMVYVRCHPWCGRHGGHYYQQINKAFVHLVFTEEELNSLGYKLVFPTQKVIHPLGTYKRAFDLVGLKIVNEDVSRSPIEPFFQNTKIVKERIRSLWKDSKDGNSREWPKFQMEQSFVDYILRIT